MRMPGWKIVAITVLVLVAAALTLEGLIRLDARHVGARAAAQFGGDRITGLTRLVDCRTCGLHERDMAVWALGELRDRRALPVLKSFHTGQKCDHSADLCQYELDKAIRKIEGTWAFHSFKRIVRGRS